MTRPCPMGKEPQGGWSMTFGGPTTSLRPEQPPAVYPADFTSLALTMTNNSRKDRNLHNGGVAHAQPVHPGSTHAVTAYSVYTLPAVVSTTVFHSPIAQKSARPSVLTTLNLMKDDFGHKRISQPERKCLRIKSTARKSFNSGRELWEETQKKEKLKVSEFMVMVKLEN
uniref:Uncharacterized protein n=1 Tax=Pristionchus pacificus TaxID=54126 RepID=A0A2A6CLV1_PRIPA|eukprot:PDM79033.1 hypothetical protein PRIPAC_31612 [Pristionchus pacificus]